MDIMTVFDGIMLIFGFYMAAAAMKMKKSGRIGNVMLTEEENASCRDKEGWINYMYWREAVFGGILVLTGGSGVASDLLFSAGYWDYVKMVLFFLAFCWFYGSLRRARQDYL